MQTIPSIIFFDIMGVLFNKIEQHEHIILEPIAPLIDLIPLLKNQVQLATLSNCSKERWEELSHSHPRTFSHFDFHILSHRVGHKKPDTRIFHTACYETNIVPEEALFIDDSLLNCETAQSIGFNTIHCADHEAVAIEIKKRLMI